MKLNFNLNLTKYKKIVSPTLILVLLFLMLVGIEASLLYNKVYGNLSTEFDDDSIDVNIVRLDINNYNKMIDLLDSLHSFQPENEVYENPFK
jgi:hypothetical protein